MSEKIVYQTNRVGMFVGQVYLDSTDLDPENPGSFLIPGGCVEQPPPTPGANQCAVWESEQWVLRPDFRGVSYWDAEGQQHTIVEIGVVVPDGATTTPPPPTPIQFTALVGRAVDRKLDELARAWRYRDYVSARSYKDDPNPKYAAEAAALIAYGSQCFTALDALEASIAAGETPMPSSLEEVLSGLGPEPTRPL